MPTMLILLKRRHVNVRQHNRLKNLKKLKPAKFFMHGKPISELRVSVAILDHYLPPDTREHTRLNHMQPVRLVLDLPTPEGWKAELT